MSSTGRFAALTIVAWCGVSGTTLAQSHPNQERGFSPEKLYEFGSVDSISTLHGTLALTIPIGPTFPIGGGFGVGLRLSGTSTVWDLLTVPFPDGNGGTAFATEAYPQRFANAGLGWRLSLGQLLDPAELDNRTEEGGWGGHYLYVDEDFGEHVFYPTLHSGDSDAGTAEAVTEYTRDASYMRLITIDSLTRDVELANGTIKRFVRANTAAPYRLTHLRDRFGNQLDVTYPTPPPGFSQEWKLADGYRDNYVRFKTVAGVDVVSEVDLASYSGLERALYTLTHEETVIDRSCKHETTRPGAPGTTVNVPLLVEIELPSGATYAMDEPGDYNTTCAGGVDDLPGTLTRLRLPTRGILAWTYAERTFPNTGFGYPPALAVESSAGVHTRQRLDEDGDCPDPTAAGNCTWTYEFDALGVAERRVVVTSPRGDDTVHYFATTPNRSNATWTGWEYGLPFQPSAPDPAGGGRFLSTVVYDGAFDAGSPSSGRKRSVYVGYEHDVIPGSSGGPEHPGDEWFNTNRRVVSNRTVFHDDADSSITMTHSDFDGLGHYRTATVSGSGIPGATRTSSSRFNPAVGSNPGTGEYRIDPVANTLLTSFTMLPASRAWVIDSFDRAMATEGTSEIVSEACFERDGDGYATTGFVTRVRSLADAITPAVRGGTDLVTERLRDADGSLESERFHGGDGASLGTGDLCSVVLPTAGYRLDHTHTAGVRASTTYVDPSSSLALDFLALDATIDEQTGLVASRRDSAGFETDYHYDSSGRLEFVFAKGGGIPQDGAQWRYTYTEASPGTFAKVQILACEPNGFPCSDPLSESEVYFDGHGRLERERRQRPGALWSKRVIVTDAMGTRLRSSELQDDGVDDEELHATIWEDFDPFGRPARIVPPDGSAHEIVMSYEGVRETTRTVKVATALDGSESASATTETYDFHGQLHSVTEPAGTSGAPVTATYGYDVAGRLTAVAQSNGTTTQNRSLVYDGRGFLREETHPEKVGRVCFLGHDARGHVGRKVDTTTSACNAVGADERDLLYEYDLAERLLEIREGGKKGRVLKEMTYYAATDPTPGFNKSKLQTATRHNYLLDLDAKVTEEYVYGGVEGRADGRTTTVEVIDLEPLSGEPVLRAPDGGAVTVFELSLGHTRLGLLNEIDYPSCVTGWCATDPGPAPRTVSNGYQRGYLTSVVGYATLSYHPNAAVGTIGHTNGVTEAIAQDPHSMARPASIATSGVSGGNNWASGAFSYDGAGNVEGIGSDRFRYDLVSRLSGSSVHLEPAVGGVAYGQTFSFDGFGNLTAVGGFEGATHDTSPATNRLTNATYDNAGNMTAWNGHTYVFDRLNAMSERITPGVDGQRWLFVYTPDEERIWSSHLAANEQHWVLRDLGGKVLRQYGFEPNIVELFDDDFESGDLLSWGQPVFTGVTSVKDYIYRGDQLLAAEHSVEGRGHFHLDHLGSPRLITDDHNPGRRLARHGYLPFGSEIPSATHDRERLKFTGHERDLASSLSAADDLDYMHARHYSPLLKRFLSVDPVVPISRAARRPQGWNLYSYVVGNPMKLVDPTGAVFRLAGCSGGGTVDQCASDKKLLMDTLGDSGKQVQVKRDGTVALANGVSSEAFSAGGDLQKGLALLIADKSTFTLAVGTGGGADTGGGKFVPGKGGGGTIFVEPQMFPHQTGDVMGTASTALVHETGHALRQLFPAHFDRLNAMFSGRDFTLGIRGEGYAVNFENRYRGATGADIRHSYDPGLLDVIIKGGVNLFP